MKCSGTSGPSFAGSFYPRAADKLSRTVTDLLSAARAKGRAGVRGIIAPHAGYVYSGPVAAEAFASARSVESRFRRAVIIGPSHFVLFHGVAAPSHRAFATPLGEIPIDTGAVRTLAEVRGALIEAARRGLVLERLDLRNSGDAAGDRESVVGYGAWVVVEAP